MYFSAVCFFQSSLCFPDLFHGGNLSQIHPFCYLVTVYFVFIMLWTSSASHFCHYKQWWTYGSMSSGYVYEMFSRVHLEAELVSSRILITSALWDISKLIQINFTDFHSFQDSLLPHILANIWLCQTFSCLFAGLVVSYYCFKLHFSGYYYNSYSFSLY